MNDFTKEELIKIKQYVDFCDYHTPISSKIQSMIDNYCDHVSDGNIYWSNPPKSKCKKCGVFW